MNLGSYLAFLVSHKHSFRFLHKGWQHNVGIMSQNMMTSCHLICYLHISVVTAEKIFTVWICKCDKRRRSGREEEREGGGLTAILCGTRCVVNADYSILPLPSLQTYRYSMTTASPSTPTPTPSIFLPSVSPTLHLIYFRWSSNMKLWCCWCDLWLQHPTTSVSHNSSLYPFLSPSILLFLSLSRSVFVFICLFTKRTIWYEEKMELMLL